MPSTYTLNNGIELIGTGEQSGTWGDTTNTNLGLLDAALDGQVTVALASAGSSGSPNSLPITDGTTSNGRNRMVVFADGGDLGATAYVQLTPNDAEKIIYIRNSLSGSRSVILFQGTYNASNDYEVPAGTTAVVYFDGAGAGAVAANVFNNAYFDGLRLGSVSVTAILDEDNMASDSATALATQQSIKAYVDSQVGTVDTLAEILAIGNTTGATDIAVDSAQKVQFRDAAIYINSSVDGQLDIVADTEIQIAATTIDVNGALDVSGTALVTGVLTTTAATVSNGGGQFNGAINVGVDDTGYDVKFFGATTGKSLLWDESADSLIVTGTTTLVGTTNLDVVDIDGATQIDATVTVGVDDTGYDVKFFGATTGKSLLWDESADSLIVTGTTTLVGTTNLDVVDIDGATQIDATVTVGVDDTGYDVKFFGATAGAYMLWDESADDLILGGAAGLSVNSTALVTGVLTTTAATVFNGGFAAGGVGAFADGSLSAPSITNTGDLNTGMYFPSAETIGFTSGGVASFKLDNQGHLIYEGSFQLQSDAQTGGLTIAGGNNSNDGANIAVHGPSHASLANITRFRQDTVESLRIDASGNIIIASTGGTLQTATAGTSNFRAGVNAGNSIASGGDYNTVVGDEAGTAITTGDGMVAIGYQALMTEDTEGYSTAVGSGALKMQNTGSSAFNVAVGHEAGVAVSTGVQNTLVGTYAGHDLNTGSYNVAIGVNALSLGTSLGSTVAIGYTAGKTLATASNNTMIGSQAGEIRTGAGNTIVGQYAGRDGTDGTDNTFIGRNSGYTITTGSKNSILGMYNGNQGGLDIRTSSNNIVLSDGDGNPRMLITATGNITTNVGNVSTFSRQNAGVTIRSDDGGTFNASRNGGTPVEINRITNDGNLINFFQDDSNEGNIAVSGSTVSYNGFSGTHESSGISTDTAIGTVVSTIDELDTYVSGSKSGQTRADHAKIKISDTEGDTRVYGVVDAYSEGDNKPLVASVGIGSVKVTGACAGGDLLESNGDGTAKVQSDDIIRSKTIGKVTIANSNTGVKLVSCVLYCG
jgi:hypothetical protein